MEGAVLRWPRRLSRKWTSDCWRSTWTRRTYHGPSQRQRVFQGHDRPEAGNAPQLLQISGQDGASGFQPTCCDPHSQTGKEAAAFPGVRRGQATSGNPVDRLVVGRLSRAILETLYSTGIRVSELVALNMDDVDFLGEILHIRGKGKKERITPISSSALQAIQHYMEYRNRRAQSNSHFDSKVLFVSKHGQRLSTRSVRRKNGQVPQVRGSGSCDQSPYAATQLRNPHAQQRCRLTKCTRTARTSVAFNDAQVYTHLTTRKLRSYDNAHPREEYDPGQLQPADLPRRQRSRVRRDRIVDLLKPLLGAAFLLAMPGRSGNTIKTACSVFTSARDFGYEGGGGSVLWDEFLDSAAMAT